MKHNLFEYGENFAVIFKMQMKNVCFCDIIKKMKTNRGNKNGAIVSLQK